MIQVALRVLVVFCTVLIAKDFLHSSFSIAHTLPWCIGVLLSLIVLRSFRKLPFQVTYFSDKFEIRLHDSSFRNLRYSDIQCVDVVRGNALRRDTVISASYLRITMNDGEVHWILSNRHNDQTRSAVIIILREACRNAVFDPKLEDFRGW